MTSTGRLAGKVAIVTGGAQGQGEAISRAFVAEGARVVIADVADEPGTLLAKELGDNARFVHHDVSSESSWADVVAATAEAFGPVTVLANNAGILRFNEIATTPVEEYELLWRVNTLGCFLGIKSVISAMTEAGGGSIINASSIEGLAGMPLVAGYTSTKFAIRGLSKAAALELGPKGIRVNSVHPGMIDTGMTRAMGADDSAMEWGGSKVALKRVGVPADIAPLYVYLASDESSYVTGAEIAIDGGATATHAYGG
ncbi:glucose 1-dehydrogenase [Nocardioides sp. Kera G14]|uniref:glucose 1-dehydrogenase n=1 Tax=Nocardioides sp. Kera G14 TaxID=2884264 RepID=UPI001D12C7C0|nr:glucose 1-dehydrogenase [Nocardioides sp. Kera G14]UDY22297.1 glucose 1-dehydrogenase [Nocardioides sp. Kera G14]